MIFTFYDFVIYVLSFVGLFVSMVYIAVLLTRNKHRHKIDPKFKPKISIIIPVWNEGSAQGERIRKTVDSLLNCNYPKSKLEIIIVNDGSTDNSLEIANSYKKHGVKVYSNKKSLGKTRAVNKGIKHCTGRFVATLDADSYIMPDVLDKLISCFKDKNVMAAIPSINIWKPKSILQKIQFIEFFSAVFIRFIQSELGAVPLAPGAFTLIRKSFIEKYGYFSHKTMVEDLEISLRIQSENFLIENVPDARVYTSGLNNIRGFYRQRIRWFLGLMIQLKKYKHLFNWKYGNLAVFILPTMVTYIFLALFLFYYAIIMLVKDTVEWIHDVLLAGIDWASILEYKFDIFFVTIRNTTVLPILLLIIMIVFFMLIKRISGEKQSIFIPFIMFALTYWFLGSLGWVLSIYYYIAKKKVKWGPNYYDS